MLHDIQTIAGNARGTFGHDDRDRDRIEQRIKKVESTNNEEDITADNTRIAHGKWRLQTVVKKKVMYTFSMILFVLTTR